MRTRGAVRFVPDNQGIDTLSTEREVGRYIARVTGEFRRLAAERVPVRTGHVRDAMFAEVTLEADGWRGVVGSDDFKAGWVEWGTVRTAAQPFLAPVLYEAVRRQLVSTATQDVRG